MNTKIAKTYRFNKIILDKLDEIIDYYSNDLLQHPGQNRKVTATAMLEYLINKEHANTVLKDEEPLTLN